MATTQYASSFNNLKVSSNIRNLKKAKEADYLIHNLINCGSELVMTNCQMRMMINGNYFKV